MKGDYRFLKAPPKASDLYWSRAALSAVTILTVTAPVGAPRCPDLPDDGREEWRGYLPGERARRGAGGGRSGAGGPG